MQRALRKEVGKGGSYESYQICLTTLMRSWSTRGEERWVASRPVIALAAVLVGLVSLGARLLEWLRPPQPQATRPPSL